MIFAILTGFPLAPYPDKPTGKYGYLWVYFNERFILYSLLFVPCSNQQGGKNGYIQMSW